MPRLGACVVVGLVLALLLNGALLWEQRRGARKEPLDALLPAPLSPKPRAAIYALVRNRELSGLLQTMRDMESNFNDHPSTRYPYVRVRAYPGVCE